MIFSFFIEAAKAKRFCPDKILPDLSDIVPDTIIGRILFFNLKTSFAAIIAALAFNESKIVSIKTKSIPPSIKAPICSTYASFNWSKDIFLYPGSSTFGDNDAILLVGPIDPATYLFLPSFLEKSSHAILASFALL